MIAFSRSPNWSRATLLVAILAAGCHPTRGCAESQFSLAPESRLPRWFKVPEGTPRAGVDVMLSYYIPLVGSERTAVVTLRTGQGYKEEVIATLDGMEPKTLVPWVDGELLPSPSYEVLRANGVTEIVEHRQRGQAFYITDDPDIRNRFGVRD
jgi:hypothetical protein